MRRVDLTTATWQKSSYSNSDGGECLEVAAVLHGTVPVRDSKQPQGAVLLLPPPAWNTFVAAVRRGDVA